ncbi:MAG: NAD(+)/NADH kinase [Ilumatobacteraceae bacterium]|nr:NAD(+)/NADH kinase [Ilumatobacteraceae bacterium]
MTVIGVTFHRFRDDAVSSLEAVTAWASANGVRVVAQADDVEALSGRLRQAPEAVETLAGVDVVVSLGGDGTMLRTVRALGGRPTPIIGVNIGTRGYLTRVEPHDTAEVLKRFVHGKEGIDYTFDDRMMLAATVDMGMSDAVGTWLALNEVVFEKSESGHTVRLDVAIDGVDFATYTADGLIVSTPTGSTAYALSARGPVMSPRLRAVLLTPVSPHMVFDRSLVLDPAEDVVVTVGGYRPVEVSVDGYRCVELNVGQSMRVSASQRVARLVRFEDRRFHQILRQKFGLVE